MPAPESNWRRWFAYVIAMYRRAPTPVVAAPSSDTRPCTSAPSIVKKRRPGLGMSLGVRAVGGDVAVAC